MAAHDAPVRKQIIVAFAAAAVLTACNIGSSSPTRTPNPPTATATPTPLLTLPEAREKVQVYASRDRNLPSDVVDNYTHVVCEGADDRYSADRHTWVIHCEFIRATLSESPARFDTLHEKTYFLDDATVEVRE